MEKYYWLNEDSRKFLSKGYLKKGVTPEERIQKIGDTAEAILGIGGFSAKFIDYLSRGWYSLASPVWSNFGEATGLPISCNSSYVEDSVASILYTAAEVGMMTKFGAGTSAYFGDVRHRGAPINGGGESFGAVHFMQLFETTTDIISQSNVRRGSFAAYYPIDGKDIKEFLEIRGDGNPLQQISMGVTVSDDWMKSMIAGDKSKRAIWAAVIKKRMESGYPYIFWSDTVNDGAPQVYKDKNLKIKSSNLCTEIALLTDKDNSFVCDLSSMNLMHFDDWKDTDAVEVLTYFLDAVMTEYISKIKDVPFMDKAYNFAVSQRALGVGALGWHSYLQSKMVAFESMEAKLLNTKIFKCIQDKTIKASKEMASLYGEPSLLEGYGMRNVTLQAVAPTTSSSFILGQVSPSIEPLDSNYFVKDLAKGKFTFKNPFLKELLASKNKDNRETWNSILDHGGSVQHLDFLSENEKDVFKTFSEISQKEIIIQAAARQHYIDQAQSINLRISEDIPTKEINELMIFAWENKVKTLYYQLGTNPSQKLARSILNCASCEA